MNEFLIRNKPDICEVPYLQTSDFTCGPACVMTGLSLAGYDIELSVAMEYSMWRRMNSVWMGADNAGCEPPAIAIELARCGVSNLQIIDANTNILFDNWSKNKDHQAVASLMRKIDSDKLLGLPVRVIENVDFITKAFEYISQEGVVVFLGRDDGRIPHWQCLAKANEENMLFDPYLNGKLSDVAQAVKAVPITSEHLKNLAYHGTYKAHAAIFLPFKDYKK